MWVCLAGIPLVVLGIFGHLGIAIDIITSPAANVALAMGVDSMIHLVVRVRRLTSSGVPAP
jgi:predicted RND superfamily exporter protein